MSTNRYCATSVVAYTRVMCWTQPVSLALGAAGMGAATYTHQKGYSKYVSLPLAYFSLMEFLQFFSYYSINQCALESNSTLTLLSYVHIAFQPIFINMIMMHSVPGGVSARTRRIAYSISIIVAGLLLAKLLPLAPASLCAPGQTLCGPQMCTVSGSWHLAWQIPLYNVPLPGDTMLYYSLAAFVVPLFYGAWASVATIFIFGPVLAYMLTGGSPNEWPAVWCLYSVAFMIVGLTPLYKSTQVRFMRALGARR